MLRISTLFSGLLVAFCLNAQVPSEMLYQAVYRDHDGTVKRNTQVDVEFQIRSGNNVYYSEVHKASTSDIGLINLIIGNGLVQSGNLSTINWEEGNLSLEVSFDGQQIQNEPFLSAPYSQLARTVEDNAINSLKIMNGAVTTSDIANEAVNSQKIADGSVGALDLSDMGASVGQVLTWDGSTWVPMTNGGGDNWGSQNVVVENGGGLMGNGDETPLAVAPLGIQTGHLADRSVTGFKLANGSVSSGHIDRMGALNGEILKWNGSQWTPGTDNDGGDSPWQRIGDTSVVLRSPTDHVGIHTIPWGAALEVDDQILVRDGDWLTVNLHQTTSGGGFIETFGPLGSENVRLSNSSANPDHGYITVRNAMSDQRGRFYVAPSGAGTLGLDGPNGNTNCLLTNAGDGYRNNGRLALYNQYGESQLDLWVSEEDVGGIASWGPNGRINILMGYLQGYPNNGFISVYDGNGNQQAGMYVDNLGRGVIFKDINSFRMEHPENAEKEIVYACIEGPEAGAYSRGVSELQNGEVWVAFPDHFQKVINADHLTITVTPQSAETYGLAVVERNDTGFRVKELAGGQGDFKFDWIAMGVRKGYEDFEVIQDKLPPFQSLILKEDKVIEEDASDEALK